MKGSRLLKAHISTIVIGIEATDMAEHTSWDFLTIACSKVSIMHSYKALVSFFPGKIIRGRTALSGCGTTNPFVGRVNNVTFILKPNARKFSTKRASLNTLHIRV